MLSGSPSHSAPLTSGVRDIGGAIPTAPTREGLWDSAITPWGWRVGLRDLFALCGSAFKFLHLIGWTSSSRLWIGVTIILLHRWCGGVFTSSRWAFHNYRPSIANKHSSRSWDFSSTDLVRGFRKVGPNRFCLLNWWITWFERGVTTRAKIGWCYCISIR